MHGDDDGPRGGDAADVDLVWRDQRATVSLLGGRITSYRIGGRDFLASYQDPRGPYAYRSALLAPWPNRIAGGRWAWDGAPLQLEVNEPASRSALHGLVHRAPFGVQARSHEQVVMTHELAPTPGYPFRLRVRASYRLGEEGLSCFLEAENLDDRAAPVGLGVHPYIAAPGLVDDVVLTLPARTTPLLDEQWHETGRRPVAAAGRDFRQPRRLGSVELDAAFTDLVLGTNGRVEVVFGFPDGPELVLWSGDTCRWLVVYTGHTLLPGERRRSMAVEPMTCNANAFVTGQDLDVLETGQRLRLDWGLHLR